MLCGMELAIVSLSDVRAENSGATEERLEWLVPMHALSWTAEPRTSIRIVCSFSSCMRTLKKSPKGRSHTGVHYVLLV